MPHQLIPRFEVLFLLMNAPWQESRALALQELDATGIDGAVFYARNGAVVDRYHAAFERAMTASPGATLLAEADELLVSVLLGLVWHHPEWVENLAAETDEALGEAVRRQLVDVLEGQEDILAGLESLGVSGQAKWQAMLLLQKPREQLGAIFGAIAENLPAFETARGAVSKELGALLAQFGELAQSTYGAWPLDLSRTIGPAAPIVPTLALPFSVLYTDDACFCGLVCHALLRSAGTELSKEELIVCAKALSDKSKVEILLLLGQRSLNGLELAGETGLTPATVSHHMGILLASGFVEVEKKGRSTYYQLSRTGIQKFLSGAGRLLLG